MSVVSNTTVLSNFAAIRELDRLRALFGRLHLPTEVHEEIQRGLEEGYLFYAGIDDVLHPLSEDGWLRLVGLREEAEIESYSNMPGRLHAGEAACLAIARHRDWLLLTDDKAARLYAERLGVRYSGSLGCLVLGVERDLWTLDWANEWLGLMVASGFHAPLQDLAPLLEQG